MAGLAPRQDLSLHPAQPGEDGGPAWVLHDPSANRYFRLPPEELEMLTVIGAGDTTMVAAAASRRLGRTIPPERAERFLNFMLQNNLISLPGDAGRRFMLAQWQQSRRLQLSRVAGTLLSLRFPLVTPDRFLAAIQPWLGWWFHPWANQIVLWSAVVGLLLVLRQWDTFVTSFPTAPTLGGLLAFAAGLTAVKALHELGHAVTAKRFGCRVGTMGVALLVFWPVLYTDCSDAWRLPSRRQRLAIDFAGVKVELAIAALCLLAWNLLPEGPGRAFLQTLATTNLVLTLSVNLNPLMRFDGYFLLSDWLSMPNLQPRSLALAKWWFDERVLRLGTPSPEPPRRWMIAYGVAVLGYRLLLSLSIAVLIYMYAFKVLGLMLMALQLGTFFGRPAWLGLKRLRHAWPLLPTGRRGRLAGLIGAAVLVLLIPWRGTVEAPAYLQASHVLHVYAPAHGQLVAVADESGMAVAAGTELVRLEAADLRHELAKLKVHTDGLRRQLAIAGFSDHLLERQAVLAADLQTSGQRIAALEIRLGRLTVTAPFDGIVVDRQAQLAAGAWVSEGEPLLILVDPAEWQVIAYIREADLGRLETGTEGLFVPAGGGHAAIAVAVRELDIAALREFDTPYLASTYGGPVASRRDESGRLLPQEAVYKVRLTGKAPDSLLGGMAAGAVSLAARRESLAGTILRTALGAMRREGGF